MRKLSLHHPEYARGFHWLARIRSFCFWTTQSADKAFPCKAAEDRVKQQRSCALCSEKRAKDSIQHFFFRCTGVPENIRITNGRWSPRERPPEPARSTGNRSGNGNICEHTKRNNIKLLDDHGKESRAPRPRYRFHPVLEGLPLLALAKLAWRALHEVLNTDGRPQTLTDEELAVLILGARVHGRGIVDVQRRQLHLITGDIRSQLDVIHGGYDWRRASRPLFCVVCTCVARFLDRAMPPRNSKLWGGRARFKSKPVQPGGAVLSLPVPGGQLHAHGSAGT